MGRHQNRRATTMGLVVLAAVVVAWMVYGAIGPGALVGAT